MFWQLRQEDLILNWSVLNYERGVNENREGCCLYISPKHWDLSEGAWIGVLRPHFDLIYLSKMRLLTL